MKTLRLGLFAVSAILLVGGYLASTAFVLRGQAADWARRIDQPPVKWLALVLCVAAVVFGFLKDADDGEEQP
jgi:succinate dehydrogenase hydrophobic anchor subunit